MLESDISTIYLNEFESLTAITNSGGEDRVTSRDSAGSDKYIGLRDLDIFVGSGFRYVARDFEITTAHGGEGDQAILYADRSGSDRLSGNSDATTLVGDEYVKTVSGFDDVNIVGEVNQGIGTNSLSNLGTDKIDNLPSPSTSTISALSSPATTFVTGDPVLTERDHP